MDEDGTATTTNPDGSVTVEQPTDFIDECQKIYDKIAAQNYTDNESEQRLIQLGCPPPDQNIEDFTPVIPDTCS